MSVEVRIEDRYERAQAGQGFVNPDKSGRCELKTHMNHVIYATPSRLWKRAC